jgi:transposase
LIAHFCRTQQPLDPAAAAVRELQARVRRVEMLQERAQQEVNRLHSGLHSPSGRASMEGTLAFLRQEIAKMQRLVQEQVERSADLQDKQRLLGSIAGSGRWTAARVLAESEQVRTSVSARQLAAYAGLPPRQHRSGTSVRHQARLAKTGNSRLRRALSLPAIVAIRHHPVVHAWAERLRARGKRPMVIVGAAMRQLVHLISRAPDLGGAQVWQALRSNSGHGSLRIPCASLASLGTRSKRLERVPRRTASRIKA